MNRSHGTLLRAMRKHAMTPHIKRYFCRMIGGHLITGIGTAHRTTAGRKYNKLARLCRLSHGMWP